MKLYHSPRSRSGRPRWLLEEMGVPYELVTLDFSKNEHKTADYLKIHPHGQVPALVDDDVTLYESAAICMYLADKFSDKGMAPAFGSPLRAEYYQWMVYSVATLELPVITIFLHTVMLPEDQRSSKLVEEARKTFSGIAHVIAQRLEGRPYLLGDFSAADVMIGSTLAWGQFMGLLAEQPKLQEYVGRLIQRPGYQKAQD
jgi:glutathione S-transferase